MVGNMNFSTLKRENRMIPSAACQAENRQLFTTRMQLDILLTEFKKIREKNIQSSVTDIMQQYGGRMQP